MRERQKHTQRRRFRHTIYKTDTKKGKQPVGHKGTMRERERERGEREKEREGKHTQTHRYKNTNKKIDTETWQHTGTVREWERVKEKHTESEIETGKHKVRHMHTVRERQITQKHKNSDEQTSNDRHRERQMHCQTQRQSDRESKLQKINQRRVKLRQKHKQT